MRACGRTLASGDKCGTLFEGSGSYCRTCRNSYMKDYHKSRKVAPLDAPRAELPGVSCECCSEALRNNTINRVEVSGEDVTLCNTCKAALKYLTVELNESQAEFLMNLATDVNEVSQSNRSTSQSSYSNGSTYVPQLTMPGNAEECIACSALARPNMATCFLHADMEESYRDSYAARLSRGEKI